MKIDGQPYRTIWLAGDGWSVLIIDQTRLPHRLQTVRLSSLEEAAHAIHSMQVRGAPLIGVTAAYGLALAMRQDPSDAQLAFACQFLASQRPTAVNLKWAIERVRAALEPLSAADRATAAYGLAAHMADEDAENCRRIGVHGLTLLSEIARRKAPGQRVNVLTHCNAGWLACVDWGTATSPIYHAHDAGIPIHVYVDETRPRNQGAALTAFELGAHGVPHTLIVDNAGGHLMQRGDVDLVIVGTDRVTARGDVANKIGTYLKALAAHDNRVPFYVALPYSTIDWSLEDGFAIPIEERAENEVTHVWGCTRHGNIEQVLITPPTTRAANPAFDVTPAKLVTGFITERGICPASHAGLRSLYPEKDAAA